MAAQPLHVHALRDEAPLGLVLLVVLLLEGREAPVVRDVDLLAAGDLALGAAERLASSRAVRGLSILTSRTRSMPTLESQISAVSTPIEARNGAFLVGADNFRYVSVLSEFYKIYTLLHFCKLNTFAKCRRKKKVADIRPKSFSFFRRHLNRILLEHQEILENAGSQCIATRKSSNTLT